jgi:hypothetical protein
VKLVYPGRHVEYYTQPITAGDVMSKNPRHCIARPDVFQNPWYVIRPESVLEPGGVFYIVPYRTISELLKAKRESSNLHRHFDRSSSSPVYQPQDRCLINPFKKSKQDTDRKVHAVHGIELKSCMRKEGSGRKSRNLRVRFTSTTMSNRVEAESLNPKP